MIYPMMVNVDFASLKDVGKKPKGLCITLVVNWLIKPFTMAALGILFFEYIFAGLVDPQTAKEYIAGMILLGVAPCTAMVFVWSQLVRGDANYTLVQVSINDIIMVFAFAPHCGLSAGRHRHCRAVGNAAAFGRALCGHSAGGGLHHPQNAGWLRRSRADSAFTAKVKPFSIMGLLATVVLLFGFQAANHYRQATGDCPDRDPAADPELRHFRHSLWLGLFVARAI